MKNAVQTVIVKFINVSPPQSQNILQFSQGITLDTAEGILGGVVQNINPFYGRNPIETDLD